MTILARRLLLASITGAIALPLVAADPAGPTDARAEIEHLLTYLGQSPCRFQRNGDWHDAARAAQHLRRKFDYYADRHDVLDTEDFIRDAATQSSLSGKPYRVACDGEPTQASADWFRAELARLRARSAGS